MAEANQHVRCSKLSCELARTGICAEGYDPWESCPYIGKSSAADRREDYEDGLETVDEPSQPAHRVSLAAGEPLTPDEVDEFLRWRPATFITIVGDRDSGKTTLIYSIYDRFLRGPFSGHCFAGSRTLIGLEKRSHYARAESGRARPDTSRTSISEGLRYFHFAVAPLGRPEARSDLMLSDRAGEVYRQARSNSQLIAELLEVKQSDRLVLLLDGGRVADPAERSGAIQGVRQTLRAFLDAGALGQDSIVQIVTTKIDLLVKHNEKVMVDAQLAAFQRRLIQDFQSRLAELSFWAIAARDPDGAFAPAHGVDRLFAEWTTLRRKLIARWKPPMPLRSEFDRLLLRTPMQVIP
jgi:Double-GTPase 2